MPVDKLLTRKTLTNKGIQRKCQPKTGFLMTKISIIEKRKTSTMKNTNNLNTGGGTFTAVSNFLKGVVSAKYEVKAIQKKYDEDLKEIRENGHKVITRKWDPGNILKELDFLTDKNKIDDRLNPDKGMFNIYIRPLDPRFILLDDLTRSVLQSLAEIKPCLLMETSPGNYQAWLKLREIPTETSAQNNIWRTLAAMFQADPDSAKRDQIGRLPGFYNRKPVYFPDYPLVKLHKFEDRFSTWEPSTTIQELPPPVFKMSLSDKKQDIRDRSAFDFAIAISMIKKGKSENEIRDYLKIKSEKSQARGDKYITRTIENARKKLGF